MTPRVLHLLVDAHGCRGPLDDAPVLVDAMRRAAAAVGAHEQGAAECRYVPHGVTAVLFLAESHLLVSTWPEEELALVEVMLCNDEMDPYVAWRVLDACLMPAATAFAERWRGGAVPT